MYITYLKSGCHSDQHLPQWSTLQCITSFSIETTGWIRQMRNQQLERLQAYSMGQHPTDMYVHQSKLQIQHCKDTTTTMYGKVNGWLTSFFYILFSGLWAPPSNSGLKKQQAGDTPAGARNFEKHLTRFGYWPRFPRRRSTAACTFPAVATSAWMFSALSMKSISRSWVSCVA